ncbi:MAG: hypothetical protein RSE27_07735 [Ruthenibacterium sp.]
MKVKRKMRRKLRHITQQMNQLWKRGVRGHDERMLVLSRRQNNILRPLYRNQLALLRQTQRTETEQE